MGYESVDQYLAQLPEGVRSHPEAAARGSVFRDVMDGHPFGDDLSRLPPEVAALLREPPAESAWVPLVYLNSLILAHVDHMGGRSEEYFAFRTEKNRAFFRQPLNRLLLLVSSPELILQGGSSRFNRLYRGLSINGHPSAPRDWMMTISYRPGLVPDLVLRSYCTGFVAAVEGAGGKNARADLVEKSPGHGTFRVTWAP